MHAINGELVVAADALARTKRHSTLATFNLIALMRNKYAVYVLYTNPPVIKVMAQHKYTVLYLCVVFVCWMIVVYVSTSLFFLSITEMKMKFISCYN